MCPYIFQCALLELTDSHSPTLFLLERQWLYSTASFAQLSYPFKLSTDSATTVDFF